MRIYVIRCVPRAVDNPPLSLDGRYYTKLSSLSLHHCLTVPGHRVAGAVVDLHLVGALGPEGGEPLLLLVVGHAELFEVGDLQQLAHIRGDEST